MYRLPYSKELQLLDVIILAPEIFKDVLILESEEIDDFDIGYQEFWLKIQKNEEPINTISIEDKRAYIRKYFSVHTEPLDDGDNYSVVHFERSLFCKVRGLDGEINDYLSYRYMIDLFCK